MSSVEAVGEQTIQAKIANAVESSAWDAIIVLGAENVQYWSGVWRPSARGYLDRPHMIVWPKGGEPVRIGGTDNLDAVRPGSFIKHFVGYHENGARPPAVIVDTLAEVLRDANLENGVIGLEMLRTSVLFYQRLCELLPDAKFEPADELLHRLRMVKTTEAIERMTQGALRTDDALWKAIGQTFAGETERDLAARIQLGILSSGCDAVTICLVGTGERARAMNNPPGPHVMREGHVVRIDVNSIYEGYFIDEGRMAFVGEPSHAQAEAYRLQLQLGESIREFIKPGIKCSEVHQFYLTTAERLGVELFIYPYIGLGHGIGVNADEYPKLNAQDHTIIEPGMILNIEPDTYGPEREIFHVEDMGLVTDEGFRLLTRSRDWTDPPIIGVPS